MSEKVTDIVKESHRKGNQLYIQGIRYQLCYAIYHLISKNIGEILLKWNNGEILIISEDIPKIELIQCRYISSDMLHFSEFCNNIIRRFIEILEESKKDFSSTVYCFKVVCNKELDHNLNKLVNLQKRLDFDASLEDMKKLFGRTTLKRIEEYFANKEITFDNFLRRVEIYPSITEEILINKIKELLARQGSTNPDEKLTGMLDSLMKNPSGVITEDQLKSYLGLHSLSFVPKGKYLSPSKKLVESSKKTGAENEKHHTGKSPIRLKEHIEIIRIILIGK